MCAEVDKLFEQPLDLELPPLQGLLDFGAALSSDTIKQKHLT